MTGKEKAILWILAVINAFFLAASALGIPAAIAGWNRAYHETGAGPGPK